MGLNSVPIGRWPDELKHVYEIRVLSVVSCDDK